MVGSIIVLIVSTALFFFYLQATTQKLLKRRFERPYFQIIARAYRLGFSSLLEGGPPPAAASLAAMLQADSLTLACLMNFRYSASERLLWGWFKVILWSLGMRRRLGFQQQAAVAKLATILQYFANVVGERRELQTVHAASSPRS
ncbi:MAG TPA: hypothetical protein VG204_18470 [Terriglobia bacterium]|nr:hypothetical protein [Terriglobia bacterium]